MRSLVEDDLVLPCALVTDEGRSVDGYVRPRDLELASPTRSPRPRRDRGAPVPDTTVGDPEGVPVATLVGLQLDRLASELDRLRSVAKLRIGTGDEPPGQLVA